MSVTSQSTQPLTQEEWDFSVSSDISDASTNYDQTYSEFVRYMHVCDDDTLPKRPVSGIDFSRVPSPTLRLKCVCCNEKLQELEDRIRKLEQWSLHQYNMKELLQMVD